jgi:nucleoside 2-deoxyribosyltransferase
MGKLSKMTTYLVGPIDRVADSGVTWRLEVTPWLEDRGVTVFNPNAKPFVGLDKEDSAARVEIDELKKQGRFREIREKYSHIRTCDLRMVDKADFLIARIDTDVHMVGTYEELFWANREKKPVLCYLVNGYADCPNWLILTLPHQFFFDSMDKLKSYLNLVDKGLTPDLRRWYFYE